MPCDEPAKESRISTRTASPRPAGRSRRTAAATGLLLSCVLATASCASAKTTPNSATQSDTSASSSAAAKSSGASPQSSSASASTANLTPVQLAGQRVIYSFTGTTVPSSLLRLIREGEAGGVIFFSSNIPSVSQLTAETKALVAAQQESPVHLPLLLMTDQEGGEVRRIADGDPTESQLTIGESSNPASAAATAGSGAAQTLSGAGLNVNLAPVLDVYAVPGNFIDQYQRSYSNDPTIVSNAAAAFISAQQKGGVAATAKHFPGLGTAAAGQDTDNVPVTLNEPLNQLRSVDELPYQAAINVGVDLIMVSWAVYPALDANRPAGLSSAIVQGELRQRLGYGGVTITDALEAVALKAYGGPGQRAVDAASAGMDLLLCSSGSVSQGEEATQSLAAALQGGQLTSSSFNAAVARVDALRSKLG
ncbi:glycoside hydrolase family 3 N-terminal domain-containing protein [Actinospica sp.]|uniref:glycoside hydrolase family 3 N-terminal domain-containing protein n=1 Tax=Actinospica sp. TaxID=1872142 RepID=UPI002D16C7F4|nr:glycoside hydrolase family 3 N-terminal domain-containing protein [Actinospica sp.]HWG24060.1 glycoside hydrolase family 3 N-terminal domain-containing protein [Actinospica sp.]